VNDYAQDDPTLVEAALRDRNAYAQLVARYEHPLARYVARLLGGHRQSVEDVLQEVFIKAYVNLNDYDRSRPFAPWLYRIAHNEAVSFLRKRQVQPQFVTGEDALLIIERAAEADVNEGTDHTRIEEIRTAIGELDTAYRDVLVLRYLEEKSYDEIADILRLPPGTVATRINRGVKRLKARLESLQREGGKEGQHD
jgi:RNA polymerase sigma-70 factor, ECF subfamily